ncbi:Os02g0247500, partial [Oryza sativa Japonica Group]
LEQGREAGDHGCVAASEDGERRLAGPTVAAGDRPLSAVTSAISVARVGSEVVMSTSAPPGARPTRAPVEG